MQYGGETLGYLDQSGNLINQQTGQTIGSSANNLYTTQAGANTSINSVVGTTSLLPYTGQAEKVLVDASASSITQTAFNGGNLGKNLVSSLETAAVYQAGADAAGIVGTQYHNAVNDATQNGTTVSLGEDVLHLGAHAAIGCAVGSISGYLSGWATGIRNNSELLSFDIAYAQAIKSPAFINTKPNEVYYTVSTKIGF